MTLRHTHAKATHHAGPVCGADDGPVTRVSDDPLQVTCPDCPDLVWIEELPNDATAGDPRIIEVLREVTRGKFLALDLDRMATVAWRILRPHL